MMTPEEENEISWAIGKILEDTDNKENLKVRLNAAFRLFHSKGYCQGYHDGQDDAAKGKDRRVVAHLN